MMELETAPKLSTHTKFMKAYMLKGLCVRAFTITNSMENFKQAVITNSQGLILRGFPTSFITILSIYANLLMKQRDYLIKRC